ncbi:hypothetical protein LXL04_025275 [Taraxacum kok-saghyz]
MEEITSIGRRPTQSDTAPEQVVTRVAPINDIATIRPSIVAVEKKHLPPRRLSMEKLRSRFFWGMEEDEKKLHWVRWDLILNGKEKGGLEVGSLLAINQALVYKWRWRFVNGAQSLWVNVIKSCYGQEGGFLYPLPNTVAGRTGVWRGVIKVVDILHSEGSLSRDVVRRQVNNGSDTRFWSDIWCGPIPFDRRFSRLFHIAVNQEARVSDVRVDQSWQLQWTRELGGLLEEVELNDISDGWLWELDGSTDFSVAVVRRHLDGFRLPGCHVQAIWNMYMPIKINVFVWRVELNRLPTRCNLVTKGIDVGTVLCPCEVAFLLWGRVANWYDAYMPFFDSYEELRQWVDSQSMVNYRRAKMEVVCVTVMWVLWNYRNGMVFVDQKPKRDMNKKHDRDWNAWMICPHIFNITELYKKPLVEVDLKAIVVIAIDGRTDRVGLLHPFRFFSKSDPYPVIPAQFFCSGSPSIANP